MKLLVIKKVDKYGKSTKKYPQEDSLKNARLVTILFLYFTFASNNQVQIVSKS